MSPSTLYLFIFGIVFVSFGNVKADLDLAKLIGDTLSLLWLIVVALLSLAKEISNPNITHQPYVELPTSLGRIRGVVEVSSLNQTYYAFKGVRYAEPVRRFEAPKNKTSWPDIYDATQDGPMCYQFGLDPTIMSEDCLTVSISTPQVPIGNNAPPNLPVIIFLFGGAFLIGSNRASEYSPHYLLSENVVVVQVNYRLNVFGFMTDGVEIPANLGVKDSIKALEFTHAIIKDFGGDPNQITLNGQSSGAAIVGYIMQSPLMANRKLFDKVILQSGNNLGSWTYQTNPAAVIDLVYYSTVTCPVIDNANMTDKVKCLKTVPAEELIILGSGATVIHGFVLLQLYNGPLGAVVMEDPSDCEAAVTRWQHENYVNGNYTKDVKVMTGIVAEEMLLFQFFFELLRVYADVYPRILYLNDMNANSTDREKYVIPAIKQFYFGSKPVLVAESKDVIGFGSDVVINVNFREFLTLINGNHGGEVYCYQFSYKSPLGLSYTYANGTGGVGHLEEQFYLWKLYNFSFEPFKTAIIPEYAYVVRKQLTRMWGNFIKFGNPTPNVDPLLQNVTWPKAHQGGTNVKCLNIDTHLTVIDNPKEGSYMMWKNLYNTYGHPKSTY